VGDDPYRDELEAAHQRIAALEAELAGARSGNLPAPLPPSDGLKEHLLPGEVVRWEGAPDPRRSVIRPRHYWLVAGWGFFLFWLVVGMMRGMPPAFSVPAGSFLLFMGGLTASRAAQAIRDARGTRYAITNRRVLLVEQTAGEVKVRSIPLDSRLSATLLLRRGGLGDLTVTPEEGEAGQLSHVLGAARAHKLLEQHTDRDESKPV